MSKVTREMIAAAHDVTMRHKIVLGHELLTEIYQAMDAKREFVGLTEEEAEDIWNRYCDEMGEASINDAPDIARAIEAKLREKNTWATKTLT